MLQALSLLCLLLWAPGTRLLPLVLVGAGASRSAVAGALSVSGAVWAAYALARFVLIIASGDEKRLSWLLVGL